MKSIIYNKYGNSDVLEMVELKRPEVPDKKLLIRVRASSVNPIDCKVRRGDMKLLTGKRFPKFAGSDFSGVVEAVGKDVAGYEKGDDVYGFLSLNEGGAYSEYLIADPLNISLKPERFSFEEAAAMPIAALTALQSLTYLADVREGVRVLINGATGGVGSFAVQIAKTFGAEVIGICSEKNAKLCKELGSDRTYDYSGNEIMESNEKLDVFFDVAAKTSFAKSKKLLKCGGIYITTIPDFGAIIRRFLNFLPHKKKAKFIMAKSSGVDLAILTGFAMTEMVKPVIENTFVLTEISKAQKLAESGKFRGKIVIKI